MLILVQSVPFNYIADWPQNVTNENPIFNEDLPDGPLRKKANEYDIWNAKFHHPYYGGLTNVIFADHFYAKVDEYGGTGDSCIWTGTYLGSQALRYAVTKDPIAKQNMIKSIMALDGYLHVTGRKGYIARYYAPQKSIIYKGDRWCEDKSNCHIVRTGKYAGDFWEGDTTKDQYTGWFFGMGLAYEFVEDFYMKLMIKTDVLEVVDDLIEHDWIILDEKLNYHVISAGQRPTYIYQLAWLNIAYHISGMEKYKSELQKRLTSTKIWLDELTSYTGYFNKYNQYYGNNLAHETWYNLLRLGKVYYSNDAYQQLKKSFTEIQHSIVNLTHNPWFNTIFMTQGNYNPLPENDPYETELFQDMSDFMNCPKRSYYLPHRDPKTYTLDPAISWVKYFPKVMEFLRNYKLRFSQQASKAFPLKLQCFAGFFFQSNPYVIDECGENNDKKVESGHDYLVTYF